MTGQRALCKALHSSLKPPDACAGAGFKPESQSFCVGVASGLMLQVSGLWPVTCSLTPPDALRRDRVHAAMRACPRDAFVGAAHAHEALVDAPIRLVEHGFNVSAPHMHACCLEALKLEPGHRCRAGL